MNPHGTHQRARQGCRCEPCHKALRRYTAFRQREQRAGRKLSPVPAWPARDHIRSLRAPSLVIAEAAGLHRTVIERIRRGAERVSPSTLNAILSVTHEDIKLVVSKLDGHVLVPSRPTREMVKDLKAAGHTAKGLGQMFGLNNPLRFTGRRVRAVNAKRIEEVYRKNGVAA